MTIKLRLRTNAAETLYLSMDVEVTGRVDRWAPMVPGRRGVIRAVEVKLPIEVEVPVPGRPRDRAGTMLLMVAPDALEEQNGAAFNVAELDEVG